MKYLFFVYGISFFILSTHAGPWAKTFNKDDKRPFFIQYTEAEKSIENNVTPGDEQKLLHIDQEKIIKKTANVQKIIIKNE